jgi:hypothetical protein
MHLIGVVSRSLGCLTSFGDWVISVLSALFDPSLSTRHGHGHASAEAGKRCRTTTITETSDPTWLHGARHRRELPPKTSLLREISSSTHRLMAAPPTEAAVHTLPSITGTRTARGTSSTGRFCQHPSSLVTTMASWCQQSFTCCTRVNSRLVATA